MSRFFITGLPRSRTAWFAVATGALHEPITRRGWLAFRPDWKDGMGVSDSGAGGRIEEIIETFAPRTLIIERPVDQVYASFVNYIWPLELLGKTRRQVLKDLAELEEILARQQSPLIKRVRFDALWHKPTLEACFDHLEVKPTSDLDQLMHMNVQSALSWNMRQLKGAA